MNPLRISATNYRSFEQLDLELPGGCVAIVGENGAGKSSIVNVIDLALFGTRNLGDYLSDSTFDEEMTLALEFEHAGELYRVRRTYSPRGRGAAKLDFEVNVFDESKASAENGRAIEHAVGDTLSTNLWPSWRALTRENAGATQELIAETIGLSRETFRASAFLAQGDGAAFTEAQPRERKAILAEVLQLDVWDRLLDRARIDRREAETEIERFKGRIEVAENELEQRPIIVAERDAQAMEQSLARTETEQAQGAAAEVATRLADAREREAARRSAELLLGAKVAALNAARVLIRDLETEADRIDAALREKPALAIQAQKIEHLEHEAVLARQAESVRENHAKLVVERNRLLGEANDLTEKVHRLEELETGLWEHPEEAKSCDRCGQLLDKDARSRAAQSYRTERAALLARAQEVDEAAQAVPVSAAADRVAEVVAARTPESVETELAGCRRASEKLAALAERETRLADVRTKLDEALSTVPTLDREKDEAAAELDRLSDGARVELLEREHGAAQHRVEQAQTRLAGLDQALARCDERIERLARLEADVAEARDLITAKQQRIDLLALAERAYGRDGVPALIVENAAIPQIEIEASRILEELGTPFRVELRTQRALKSGDGVRDTLDIVICSPAGERPYETFSGGERTRLNLALRIALARLLAHRRGAESRLLAIDEPEFLDDAGVQKLADVLRGLAGDFDRIVLISHVPTLATAFDQTLTVVKDGDRSRIADDSAAAAGADTRAEVAA